MTPNEVLRRYAAGERDFRRTNLRGQSFKGQNLSGADFRETDIRGANFTNAILKGAKFSGAKAGLQRRWVIGLVISSWLLSGLSGIFSGFAGYTLIGLIETKNSVYVIASTVCLVTLAVFFIVTIRKGLAVAFAAVAGAVAGAVAFTLLLLSAYIGWR